MKMEADNQISFLDVSVKRNAGTFATKVYRKPTHTDLYIHYSSHHHPSVKSGTVRCLGSRAETICVDEISREEELAHLRDTFRGNGYPDRIVTNDLRKPPRTTLPSDEEQPTTNPSKLFLPYIQGLSENIQNRCRKMGIRTVFKSRGTLRQLLMNVKTPIPEMNKKEVVYQIPCQDCDSVYIGETGRSLGKRIAENKYAIKTGDRKNGVAVHGWDEGHRVDWEGLEKGDFLLIYTPTTNGNSGNSEVFDSKRECHSNSVQRKHCCNY